MPNYCHIFTATASKVCRRSLKIKFLKYSLIVPRHINNKVNFDLAFC